MKRNLPIINNNLRSKFLMITATFGVIGIAALVLTSAAPQTNRVIEPETGSVLPPAQLVNDTNASNGSALLFQAQSVIQLPSPGSWTNVTNNLASVPTECGTLTLVSPQPGTNRLLAGVAGHGLYASDDFGASWFSLSKNSITNRPNWISYDPANSNIYYEVGTWDPGTGGVFKTTDNGVTFQRLGNISSIDFISIDYSDPNRQLMLAGQHETSKTVWKSTNGGATWTNIGANIAGNGFSDAPVIINTQTYVVNTSGTGIYRTTNGGATWTQVSTIGTRGYPALVTTKRVIYYSDGDALARSSDSGLTWTRVGSGFREGTPYELPDGRLIMIGGNNLMVSNSDGSSWSTFGANYPSGYNVGWPPVGGVIYSKGNNAFYMWHWTCENTMLSDSIVRLK